MNEWKTNSDQLIVWERESMMAGGGLVFVHWVNLLV